MHGITPRFLTSTSTFRPNAPMPTAWTAALEWSQSSNRFVMLRGRTCSYRLANLRLGEPRSWKRCPGEHCRRHRRLLLRRTRCRRTIRQRQRPLRCPLRHHQKQLRVAPYVRRQAANLRLRERARQVYRRADKHAVAPPAWRHVPSNAHCTTCARSLALYTNVETQATAYHLENASLFAEYAYVFTASAGNHSRRGNKLKVPNTFKEAMSLRDGMRRQTRRSSASRSTASTSWYLRPPSLLDKR